MGYACPVCETPQADAGHLANHLAITAIARGGDHETWLDEHVPEWADLDEDGLAERVAPAAEAAEYPQVFEDTTDRGTERTPGAEGLDAEAMEQLAESHADDEDVAEIVERARELTRQRREDSETE